MTNRSALRVRSSPGPALLILTGLLGALAACPGGTEAEPIDAAGAERFAPIMVDAGQEAGSVDSAAQPDAAQPDRSAPDLRQPDLRLPDTSAADSRATDSRTADLLIVDAGGGVDALPDVHAPDLTAWDSAPGDATAADAAAAIDAAAGDLDLPDAAPDDAGAEDGPPPPLALLKVEIDQDNWSEEMYVDWSAPSGATCDCWDDPDVCDWGLEGIISISGDEYGNADPNWAEISGARVDAGAYRAYVYAYCMGSGTCEVDEVRIYVDGQRVRTIAENRDLTYGSEYLCMPVANGAWDVDRFHWQWTSSCD